MVPPMRLVSLPILGKSGLGRAAVKLPPLDLTRWVSERGGCTAVRGGSSSSSSSVWCQVRSGSFGGSEAARAAVAGAGKRSRCDRVSQAG